MTIADDGLRDIVRTRLHKENGWCWTPVETGTTLQGVPDSFWAHEPSQTNGWIEHKATTGWAVTVRPHQISWFERHIRAGVHCVLMIRARGVGSARGAGDSLWVVSGSYIRTLSLETLQGLPRNGVLGRWTGKPKEWDWGAVQEILTGSRG